MIRKGWMNVALILRIQKQVKVGLQMFLYNVYTTVWEIKQQIHACLDIFYIIKI